MLFLSHSARWGGAEKCLYELVTHLPLERIEPVVAFPGAGALEEAVRQKGIETRRMAMRSSMGYIDLDAEGIELFERDLEERIAALAASIRNEGIDLVFTNTITIVEGALAAARVKVPHVWHVLEMLSIDRALPALLPLDWIYSSLDALSDAVVVVSEGVRTELRNTCPATGARVVHTGIEGLKASQPDKRATLGLEPGTAVVTYVGLLSERKGVTVLGRAWPTVCTAHPDAHCLFVGPDGGDEGELRKTIRRQGFERSVTLTGSRRDIADVLAASDIFVMPSLADPLPVSVLEAMSVGLPVVATRSGGCEEMVVDGETGLLVSPSDPGALAAAIGVLLSDPERARRMGERGRERFWSRFRVDRHVDDFVSIMTECASRGAGNGEREARAALYISLLRKAARDQASIYRLQERVARFEQHPALGRLLRWRRRFLGRSG